MSEPIIIEIVALFWLTAWVGATTLDHIARDIREGRFPQKSESMSAWDDRFTGSAKEIEAHTIERCAQVAEQYMGTYSASDIAAAIRKLKDES